MNPLLRLKKISKGDSLSIQTQELEQSQQRKGWKAMPYILGNESFERLATMGLMSSIIVYLTREYHYSPVTAAYIFNTWNGITNFLPVLGGLTSDAYLGRFKTIIFASVAAIVGMMIVTLTPWLPNLHPPKCNPGEHCRTATTMQLAVLSTGLLTLSIGSGGIRPCSIQFGVDQFNPMTDKGDKGITSYFNWYYTSLVVLMTVSKTVVIYIQDQVSWVLGFGIPTSLMVLSLVVFFAGRKIYFHVKPEGSALSGIVKVIVSVYHKRKLKMVSDGNDGQYYDPPLLQGTKLPLTPQFRFLNKAAIITDKDHFKTDGSPANNWRLCTIQQVEEVKCLLKIIPIWALGIVNLTSMTQLEMFSTVQAAKMNRHVGTKFQVPVGSITSISSIMVGIWLPVYNYVLIPVLSRVTKHKGGITHLQRMGIGIIFSILSMVVAGLVEKQRRDRSNHELTEAPISFMWLAPQLILMGFFEAFNVIGQMVFFNSEFPNQMKSVANSLLPMSFGLATYINSLVVATVHHAAGGWFSDDINNGRLDLFYYVIAGMVVVNYVGFLYCASHYQYKDSQDLVRGDDRA